MSTVTGPFWSVGAWAATGPDRGLVYHSDRGVHYVSMKYSERLAKAGIEPGVGSRASLQPDPLKPEAKPAA